MRAAAVDDIIHDDAVAPRDIADHVHDFGNAGLGPPLVDDGEVAVELLGQRAGAHHAADVGRDHDQVVVAA
eukprot:gene53445-65284_t